MEASVAARWIYFVGAIILAFTLSWFGWQLLHTTADSFSNGQLLIFGLLTTGGGICLLTLADIRRTWLPGVLVTLVGFYGCARAAGIVKEPWLEHVLGVLTWVAAAVLLYAAWPLRTQHKKSDDHHADRR